MPDLDALLAAIIRTYDGQTDATVQIDPPVHRSDGIWYAHLMLNCHDSFEWISIAVGRGKSFENATLSLAALRGVAPPEPPIVEPDAKDI